MQLPDWNHWLPRVHPMDAWSDFAGSEFAAYYPLIRSTLNYQDATAYQNSRETIRFWVLKAGDFLNPKILPQYNPVWTADLTNDVYSAVLWKGVKTWEIMQEFGLEGLNQAVFGPQADPRGWYSVWPFDMSPNMQHIPRGAPGIDNGLVSTEIYVSFQWYQLQMLLNNSGRTQSGSTPIDYPYVQGFIKDTSVYDSQPQAALQILWLIKGLQESETGIGPEAGSAGWQPWVSDPNLLVNTSSDSIWSAVAASTRKTYSEAYLRLWFAKVQAFTPQQFYLGGWADPTVNPLPYAPDGAFGDQIWYMIPRFVFYGIDPNLLSQVADWAKNIWPNVDWDATKTASCYLQDGIGPTRCTTDQ